VTKCAYQGEKIREIEEKWIDENIKDEKERMIKKIALYLTLGELGEKANCELEAVSERGLCMFHDPEYWKSHADEVREEFLKLLKNGKRLFVGFHLPGIKFPEFIKGNLCMSLAKIQGILDTPTRFQGEVLFNGATFQGITLFSETVFQGNASFDKATFQGAALFDEVTFQEEARFNEAIFQIASFHEVTFQKRAWFNEVTFQEEGRFDEATFQEHAWFDEAIFQKDVSFVRSTFQGLASFYRATFQGDTRFSYLDFGENGLVIFESAQFKNPYLVNFEVTDMSRFLFLNTSIEKISLRNAKLHKSILRAHELLRKWPGYFTFDDVIETYGRLRGNLEENHRYSDAGRFFVGEMEARRERKYYETKEYWAQLKDQKIEKTRKKYEGDIAKQQQKSRHTIREAGRRIIMHMLILKERIVFFLVTSLLWLYVNIFSPLALYKHFSKYGESIWRPIAWSILTIFLMPFLFIWFGNQYLDKYFDNLKLSISLFFQLAPVDYREPMSILLLSILERILGLLFSALEVLALKRMLERHP